MIMIERTCPFCGEKMGLWVKQDEFDAWQNGALVQNAFPDLSPEEREFIISGICENCWEEKFGSEKISASHEILYHVWESGNLLAGFVSLATTIDFIENWRSNSDVAVDLVDAKTGEVLDTWVNGAWENGDY